MKKSQADVKKNSQKTICQSSSDWYIPPGLVAMKSTPSIATRTELLAFYKKTGFKDIKFWVSPKSIVSKEECESQALAALKAFVNGESKLIPQSEIFKKFQK